MVFFQRKATGAAYSDAYLRVDIKDVNNEIPEFQGLSRTGVYPAAVSDQTKTDDVVLTVIAIDLDGEAPNNVVCEGSFVCSARKIDLLF